MNPDLSNPAFWHRLHFAFTMIYHYLFPQLTTGLAWFIVFWKWKALSTGEERYAKAARFWAKIFGLNFAVGVVTGIPMEFQFGTNWAAFSKYSGEVIGQTLAMEGMFAFFLESAMVGALVWGGEAPWPAHSLPGCSRRCSRELAVGGLHFGHECFYAAPGGLRDRAGWLSAARGHRRVSAESMGACAVHA